MKLCLLRIIFLLVLLLHTPSCITAKKDGGKGSGPTPGKNKKEQISPLSKTALPEFPPAVYASVTVAASAALPSILYTFRDVITEQGKDIAPFVPFRRWQVLNTFIFLFNRWAGKRPGRMDMKQPRAEASQKKEVARFFTPAGWAFRIWIPIFIGETIFVFYQALPINYIKNKDFLAMLSPFWIAAIGFQSIWTFCARPWAVENGYGWIQAALLVLTGVALSGVHKVMTSQPHTLVGDLNILDFIVAQIPLSLHFGWMMAAGLVSVNGVLARTPLTIRAKHLFSDASVVVATVIGVVVAAKRTDPVVAFALSWALAGLADDKAWEKLKSTVSFARLQSSAKLAKRCSNILALTIVGLTIEKAFEFWFHHSYADALPAQS